MRRTTFLAAALILAGTSAFAETNYPTRPITMIVPFAAGGPTDTVGRLIAEPMTARARPAGAGRERRRSRGHPGRRPCRQGRSGRTHHPAVPYRAGHQRLALPQASLRSRNGFHTCGKGYGRTDDLCHPPGYGSHDRRRTVDYLRTNKDDISLVNAGVGSASHLCGMVLMKALDVPMTTVPYKGTAPAMTDLIGGRVDVMCDQSTNTSGQIKSGSIKAYGVTSTKRLASLPDLPTLAESGLDGFEVSIWHGIWAPKGTPAAVVSKLESALQTALKDPMVIQRFADLGTEPVPLEQATPAALDSHLKAEIERWKPIVQAAGVFAD